MRRDARELSQAPRPGGEPRLAAPVANRPRGDPGDLRIGGLTALTTVDYPGELAAVVFCQGCPWRCPYCHNGHLLQTGGSDPVPWGEVRALLERRRGLLDAVVFSGGEPTLQPALPAAIRETRTLGFKVGLHTAGCYPQKLARLLRELDWVGLDIKALPDDYPSVTGVPGSGEQAWESLRILRRSGLAFEVRTTVMPEWTAARQIAPLMGRLATAGVRQFVLQRCRTETTLDPAVGRGPAPDLPPSIADMGSRLFSDFSVR